MKNKYYTRLVEKKIQQKLNSSGAILINGPKFCGKTTTSKLFAKSSIQLIDNDIIEIVNADPKNALRGDKPRLIDEWQSVPKLWDYIRKTVDDNGEFGEYILTGSSTPYEKSKIHHSGSGRITTITMKPMSLFESKESKGSISLQELFDNPSLDIFDLNDDISLNDIAFYIMRGGWPLSIQDDRNIALDVTKNYYDGLFNFQNSENINYKSKKPQILRMLLRSYARNISSSASYQTILEEITSSNKRNMDIKTFNSYLEIAEELFIIEDLEAWTTNLRSKTAIRTAPTRHFVDPSIACLALEISATDLLKNSNTFGLFFEDFAIRDLRIYMDYLNGSVKHYRDSRGLECDAILHLSDSRWAACEIKLGSEKGIEEGAKSLNKLESDLKEDKPTFKMILTACSKAYKRNDGIYVIPINLLKN